LSKVVVEQSGQNYEIVLLLQGRTGTEDAAVKLQVEIVEDVVEDKCEPDVLVNE
jgi:hypothetical protein